MVTHCFVRKISVSFVFPYVPSLHSFTKSFLTKTKYFEKRLVTFSMLTTEHLCNYWCRSNLEAFRRLTGSIHAYNFKLIWHLEEVSILLKNLSIPLTSSNNNLWLFATGRYICLRLTQPTKPKDLNVGIVDSWRSQLQTSVEVKSQHSIYLRTIVINTDLSLCHHECCYCCNKQQSTLSWWHHKLTLSLKSLTPK